MGFLDWLTGASRRRRQRREKMRRAYSDRLHARYDAAQTTRENEKHWSNADLASPYWSHNSGVRATLVKRARYERDNNCYAKGILDTLVTDLVGTGARLQVQSDVDSFSRIVEERWRTWCTATDFVGKLQTYSHAHFTDGEGISIAFENPKVDDPVRLDFRLVETEQLTNPNLTPYALDEDDGIKFDAYGNVESYRVLRYHPGDWGAVWNAGDTIPAQYVFHWFRSVRPNQTRGVPYLTAALPLFAQLRRYTLAVLTAAEIAAMFAATLETDVAPGEADQANPFEELDIARGMMTVLPDGWKMNQFNATQPTQSYEMFKRELLSEVGRVLGVPYNIAAGTSMNYNYSSGRLDHLLYFANLRVLRAHLQRVKIDPAFRLWYRWGRTIPGYFPAGAPAEIKRIWYYDSRRSIDPEKDAKADTERLANGTTTLADIYAEEGRDWQDGLVQRAREIAAASQLQAAHSGTPASGAAGAPASQDVQTTALNGAQVDALLAVVGQMGAGQIPPAAARAILGAAFPLISPAVVDEIISSFAGFTPRPTTPAPPGSPAAGLPPAA